MQTLDDVISNLMWVNLVIDFIGVAGNVTTTIVLAHRKIRCSTSMLLIVMGVYDSVFLVTDMSLFFSQINKDPKENNPFQSTVFHIAATGSVYTAVAVTVERYVAVRHPFKAMTHCLMFKMWKPILLVLVLSILVNVPRHLDLHSSRGTKTTINISRLSDNITLETNVDKISKISDPEKMDNTLFIFLGINDSTAELITLPVSRNKTDFQTDGTKMISVDCYHVSAHPPYRYLYCHLFPAFVILFIPFAVILSLNVLILKTLSVRQQTMNAATAQSTESGRGLTHAALGITTCFFVFGIFPGIYFIVRYAAGYSFGHLNSLTESVCYTLLLINFSTNFILYCFLGRNFRHICLEVFCWRNPE